MVYKANLLVLLTAPVPTSHHTKSHTTKFVTFWKRNEEKQTEPFHVNDDFDFYIIVCFDNEDSGFFLFPKNILAQNKFLSSNEKEGKRGFRVYPDWVETENNQAKKTQAWQVKYFINFKKNNIEIIKKTNSILIQQ